MAQSTGRESPAGYSFTDADIATMQAWAAAVQSHYWHFSFDIPPDASPEPTVPETEDLTPAILIEVDREGSEYVAIWHYALPFFAGPVYLLHAGPAGGHLETALGDWCAEDDTVSALLELICPTVHEGGLPSTSLAARFEVFLAEEGLYRRLIDAVTDYAIYMLDPTGVVTSWNAGARRFNGYDAAEILGKNYSVLFTEEDRRNDLPARALETVNKERRFETECWLVRKDGGRFWAHVIIDPIHDAAGRLLGFAKITRDLTERKLLEQAVKANEAQFELLVQSITDYAVYQLSPEGVVVSWNSGAHRIKGYLPEEIIGQHFSIFFTEEDKRDEKPQQALSIAVREGRFSGEGWRIRKDGSRFWASAVIDPIWRDDDTLVGFAKVTRDITEAREAQQLADQSREALFQARKMEVVGQLTAGVAHDFNNILAAVMGGIEVVLDRLPSNPRFTPLLTTALQAARRGKSLTRHMLSFARSQSYDLAPVDVSSLIIGMLDLLERTVGPLVTIRTHFATPLPAVNADAHQLELALLNLALNARDAMPDGGLITIEASQQSIGQSVDGARPGEYICLSVSDEGEGMDEATLARAVDPFFTTKDVGKGTGLGLSMVHGATEQIGGRFILKSQKGKGTRAEIWLPLAHVRLSPSSPPSYPPSSPPSSLGDGQRDNA